MERHATGPRPRSTREFEQPIRRDSEPDRGHFDSDGPESDPRPAGENQCGAWDAAKRTDQESDSVSGDPGAGIGLASADSGTRDRRSGKFRNPVPTRSLRFASIRALTWDSLAHLQPGSTGSSPPTSVTTRPGWHPSLSLRLSRWQPSM